MYMYILIYVYILICTFSTSEEAWRAWDHNSNQLMVKLIVNPGHKGPPIAQALSVNFREFLRGLLRLGLKYPFQEGLGSNLRFKNRCSCNGYYTSWRKDQALSLVCGSAFGFMV